MKAAIPAEVRRQVLERDKACVYCGRPVSKIVGEDAPYSQRWRALDERGITFHFEHRVPRAAGGLNTADNICIACPECNLTKARSHDRKAAREGKTAMTRVIKVEDKIYDRLDRIRDKGQTFSQVIEDLLTLRGSLFNMINVLEGQLKYNEWKAKRLQELEAAQKEP